MPHFAETNTGPWILCSSMLSIVHYGMFLLQIFSLAALTTMSLYRTKCAPELFFSPSGMNVAPGLTNKRIRNLSAMWVLLRNSRLFLTANRVQWHILKMLPLSTVTASALTKNP